MFNNKEQPGDYYPEPTTTPTKKPSTFKILIGTVGALFAVSHIGLVGYVIRQPDEPPVPQVPTINIPRGDYSSYTIELVREVIVFNTKQTILLFLNLKDH